MQAYAACDDPDVREVVRDGLRRARRATSSASRAPTPDACRGFFAHGMLLNVLASMDLLDADEPWAERLLAGCRHDVSLSSFFAD